MYPMDPRLLKQMHEQMVRDAQRKALPRELRAVRKRRAGWASALTRYGTSKDGGHAGARLSAP
jgi:hypothetical protein